MKNKVVKAFAHARFKLPMNLQYFAEGGDGSGAGGDGDGSGEGGDGDGSGEGNGSGGDGKQSFDDFLKGDGNQAEFDRRVNKAVQTALGNAREKWEALTNDKLSEAEKLAKMTKEEKADYLQKKKEKELNDREAAVTRSELKAEAKNTLAEKKLPPTLADLLDYKDADACKKSIETVEKIFQEAVQTAVEQKLKGGEPMRKAGEKDGDLEKQIEKIMRGY